MTGRSRPRGTRQQPLHDGRHCRQVVHPVLGDQPEEPPGSNRLISTRCWPVAKAMVAEVNPVLWLAAPTPSWVSGGQVCPSSPPPRRPEPAVPAGLDQLGPPGAAAENQSTSAPAKPPPAEGASETSPGSPVAGDRGTVPRGSGADQQARSRRSSRWPYFRRRAGGRTAAMGRHQLGGDGLHPLDRVGQRNGDVIAPAHTESGIPAGQPAGHRLQFTAGDGPPTG